MGNSGLSKYLIQDGLLSKQDCQTIARETGNASSAFAKGVIALGIFNEGSLARYISEKTRLPIIPRERLAAGSAKVLGAIDLPLLQRLEVLPVEIKGKTIVVAMADPLDEDIVQQLNFFVDYRVERAITTTTAIQSTLKGLIADFAPEKSSFQSLLDRHMPKQTSSRASKKSSSASSRSLRTYPPQPAAGLKTAAIVDDVEDYELGPVTQPEQGDEDLDIELSNDALSTDLDDFSVADDDFKQALSEGEFDADDDDLSGLGGIDLNGIDIDLDGLEDNIAGDSHAEKSEIDLTAEWSDESVLPTEDEDLDSPITAAAAPSAKTVALSDEFDLTTDGNDDFLAEEAEIDLSGTPQSGESADLNLDSDKDLLADDSGDEDLLADDSGDEDLLADDSGDEDLLADDSSDSGSTLSQTLTLDRQDDHDFGIGHLNHALALISQTQSVDEAIKIAGEGLSLAQIAEGFIFSRGQGSLSPLGSWPPLAAKQLDAKSAAFRNPMGDEKWSPILKKDLQWTPIKNPPIKFATALSQDHVILGLTIAHAKGIPLVILAIWPEDAAKSQALRDIATTLFRQISRQAALT